MESKFKFDFEIGTDFKNSLMLLQQKNIILNEVLCEILEVAVKNIKNPHTNTNISSINTSKKDIVKELYAALVDLMIQVARHDLTGDDLEQYCSETLKLSHSYTQIIVNYCTENKAAITPLLSGMSVQNIPILDGFDWKLDCIVKTSEATTLHSNTMYRIRLRLVNFNNKTEENNFQYVTFNCDAIELTDLVFKLKEICHHIERLENNFM